MIVIEKEIYIDEKDLDYKFIRSSGPGGQNVNKVSTAVQLKFNIRENITLSAEIKNRLMKLSGSKVSEDGILLIEAKRFRTRERNRIDALNRLKKLILLAVKVPVKRIGTIPTKSSQAKRLETKKKLSDIKKSRKKIKDYENR
ncbi:MAG: alternative ribosome rescue aminoacyl-tRNA hydrolase ArfB [Acidobacteriota bacterium]